MVFHDHRKPSATLGLNRVNLGLPHTVWMQILKIMVPLRNIRQYACDLARRFNPERVILFGSYARRKPGPDSDVDLLVVMDCRGDTDEKALELRLAVPREFPLDLIVRTPRQLQQRLKMGDTFVTTILKEGRVLYER
jgi:predicted nucleotidyltransferase